MADLQGAAQAGGGAPEFVDPTANAGRKFPPKGEPQIVGFNRIGLWSLYMKEVRRFLKVHTQTIWAPALTTVLFLLIFTVALGRGGREVLGFPFADFVAPGLIMMGMMQSAFANSSFTLLTGKLQGTIIDVLMPPLTEGELMIGIVAAAVTRGLAVGAAVAVAMLIWPDVSLRIAHPWAIVWFGMMGAILLALMGLLTSIWAEKFDHAAAVTNFVVAPLSLLSGTFYVISSVSPVFQAISHVNPFFYAISGFRFGFLGRSDIGDTTMAVVGAAIGLGLLNLLVGLFTYRVLRSGWKLRS